MKLLETVTLQCHDIVSNGKSNLEKACRLIRLNDNIKSLLSIEDIKLLQSSNSRIEKSLYYSIEEAVMEASYKVDEYIKSIIKDD